MKKCEICESFKKENHFEQNRNVCKVCRQESRKDYNSIDWEDPSKLVECTKCLKKFPLTRANFNSRNRKGGYRKSCKKCSKNDSPVLKTKKEISESYIYEKILMIEKNSVKEKLKNPINLKNGDVITSDCINSTRYINSAGYPCIYYWDKDVCIHRLYYCLKNNIDIFNFNSRNQVRHLCNNKLCFNIDHLAVGIHENNYDDKKEAGTLPVGEKAYNAKLNSNICLQIKKSKFPKDHPEYLTQEERAKKFGTTVFNIRAIDSENSWATCKTENSKSEEELKKNRDAKTGKKEENRHKFWTPEMFEQGRNVFFNHENLLKYSSGCFVWTGKTKALSLYGVQFHIKTIACSLKYKTHRPKKFFIRNLCEDTECCNPDHLVFLDKDKKEITEQDYTNFPKEETEEFKNEVEPKKIKHRKGLKLSIEKAEDIRIQVHLKGASIKEMCEKYDVHNTVINDIVKNKKWKIDEQEFLEKYLNCSVYVGKKITREMAEEIRKLYSLGNTTYQKLADLYNCSVANIKKIIKFETFK